MLGDHMMKLSNQGHDNVGVTCPDMDRPGCISLQSTRDVANTDDDESLASSRWH